MDIELYSSMHDPAAVDIQRLAGDEARRVGGEEGESVGDVVGAAASLQRLMAEDEARIALRFGMDLLGVGREGARRDRVDGNAVGAELARPGAGQADEGAYRLHKRREQGPA